MTEKKLFLQKSTRTFVRSGAWKVGLTSTGYMLEVGTLLTIGTSERVWCDNREQVAVPCMTEHGHPWWILTEEAGIDLDQVPGIEAVWIDRAEQWAPTIDAENETFFAELRLRKSLGLLDD